MATIASAVRRISVSSMSQPNRFQLFQPITGAVVAATGVAAATGGGLTPAVAPVLAPAVALALVPAVAPVLVPTTVVIVAAMVSRVRTDARPLRIGAPSAEVRGSASARSAYAESGDRARPMRLTWTVAVPGAALSCLGGSSGQGGRPAWCRIRCGDDGGSGCLRVPILGTPIDRIQAIRWILYGSRLFRPRRRATGGPTRPARSGSRIRCGAAHNDILGTGVGPSSMVRRRRRGTPASWATTGQPPPRPPDRYTRPVVTLGDPVDPSVPGRTGHSNHVLSRTVSAPLIKECACLNHHRRRAPDQITQRVAKTGQPTRRRSCSPYPTRAQGRRAASCGRDRTDSPPGPSRS